GDGAVHEGSVALAPAVRVWLELQKTRVGRVHRGPHTIGMATVAGPLVVTGVLDHPRLYRVQFDIPLALQKIAFAVHRARLESALPQGAGALVFSVVILGVSLPDRLHKSGKGIVGVGRDEQVG